MNHMRVYTTILLLYASNVILVSAAASCPLTGTVEIEIPYKELARNEGIDVLMMITNTGMEAIPYWGNSSDLTIYPEQAVIKWVNRSEGLRTPLGQDDAGLMMNWNEFKNDALSTIPLGGAAFFKISSIGKAIHDRDVPRDSMIVEIIVGKDAFLSSDIVDLPPSSEVDPAVLPSIATFKWANGWTELIKKTVIGEEEFLFSVTDMPGFSKAHRIARIPHGCDVTVSHDPVVGSYPDGVLLKMTVRFIGGQYEDLVYNAGRYHILSGHPDTVPNAFMRISRQEATAEEARKCLEENSRKAWLKSFGKSYSRPDGTVTFGKNTNSLREGNASGMRMQGADTPRSRLLWTVAAVAIILGGGLMFMFIRRMRSLKRFV